MQGPIFQSCYAWFLIIRTWVFSFFSGTIAVNLSHFLANLDGHRQGSGRSSADSGVKGSLQRLNLRLHLVAMLWFLRR